MEILKVEGISKNFGGVAAVTDFSLVQRENEISGIIGPNGAGKTTTFNLITGVQSLDSGRIWFRDAEITRLPAHRRTGLGIARTFQNIRLFHDLTVLDNLKVACGMRMRCSVWEEMVRLPRVSREERRVDDLARSYLAYLDLERYAGMYPNKLPYGLQRRLELARALMAEPALLLLDEPAAGLNPREIRDLIGTIERLQRDKSLTILLVEHHMELVMNICRTIHVLDFGRKIAEGRPEEIKKDKKVLQAYLGDEV